MSWSPVALSDDSGDSDKHTKLEAEGLSPALLTYDQVVAWRSLLWPLMPQGPIEPDGLESTKSRGCFPMIVRICVT
jgi:hypothetical protein